jgi:hypothetical protein
MREVEINFCENSERKSGYLQEGSSIWVGIQPLKEFYRQSE